ncbi:DUF3173 family protein [Listeria monocytogenes]|uniref:DUF3173 family protein n=1 Tax=Listeria TaxID=1637 RepID=UPI000E763B01|nr:MULTISPECIES: DUF3173 family protein [Listeria]EAD2655840.1 DUF3173 domain-containing protein [Listeria monocytogenes]EAD7781124.1 DUF3173 domain-containing protein [Listeria monocytogenes]EAD7872231.1 DUF3173 domain-containing protein [Listeria monocytogenes]EBF5187331.1 DUF3173 domain-containing protein [Listeria monocytogenes]EBF5841947.1 DUF3173 domain-containing protein [Listeria monocytogenes]
MKYVTLTKDDLIKLGYGSSASESLIREAKVYMVNQGFDYYKNRRLGRVPKKAIEAILGINLAYINDEKENDLG